MISHERLLQVLKYDPKTGEFEWRGRKPGSRPGKTGFKLHHQYLGIRIDGRIYYQHRLAWFYVHGRWPDVLDHKNENGGDNRIDNLREATRSQNHANRSKTPRNTTGFKGVVRWGSRFKAQLNHRKKCYYLGLFDDPEAAHAAYCAKALELFGEFANGG